MLAVNPQKIPTDELWLLSENPEQLTPTPKMKPARVATTGIMEGRDFKVNTPLIISRKHDRYQMLDSKHRRPAPGTHYCLTGRTLVSDACY